jgi:hypothetical protein
MIGGSKSQVSKQTSCKQMEQWMGWGSSICEGVRRCGSFAFHGRYPAGHTRQSAGEIEVDLVLYEPSGQRTAAALSAGQ